jgi:MSHA biogenesis protein MshP
MSGVQRRARLQRNAAQQRGVSVVLILGVMVLMLSLLAFASSFTTGQGAALAQEINGARARQAALTGLEWGRYQLTQVAAPCVAVTQLTVPLSSGNMRVTVRCVETPYVEVGTVPAPRVSQLTATACTTPGPTGCPNAAATGNYAEAQAAGWVER